MLQPMDFDKVKFVGESLKLLRQEAQNRSVQRRQGTVWLSPFAPGGNASVASVA